MLEPMPRFALVSCSMVIAIASCAGAREQPEQPDPEAPVVQAESVRSPAPEPAARPTPSPAQPDARRNEPARSLPYDARWVDPVRSAVALHASWGRVDDESRWAPFLCRMPRAAPAHASESGDAQTHGHKLYTLYAMDPVAYGARPSAMPQEAAVLEGMEQVIVKESFLPVPWEQAQDRKTAVHPSGGRGEHRLRPAERDGKRFVAGRRQGLYVMMKPKGQAEGTDAGWVYATVESDMITVTAVGVIESCASCHREAGPGRLFGLPDPSEPAKAANSAPSPPL